MGVPIPHLPFPPLWRETRAAGEAAALFRSRVWRGEGVPGGDGRPVMLIPGFLAGDGSLMTLARWLRELGYYTHRAGIRANIACSETACARLETRLEELAEVTGRPVALVGQSRGGVFARALAVRRPDLVAGIATLGAPTVSQLSVHPVVLAHVGLVAALGTGRLPGMLSVRCLRGVCCARFREDLLREFPDDVGYVALYSRTDGIVNWRACLDPAAEQIEVRASHMGMGLNAGVYRILGDALAGFADRGEPELAEAAQRLSGAASPAAA